MGHPVQEAISNALLIGSRVQTRESTYGGARSRGLTFEKGLTLLGKGPRAMHITQRLEAVVQMINNRNLQ
ncbi:hypothetical protein GOBAR_AA18487 [Gossypium barbadense]|uniref:Uncharacterized protein n=1 Tax=Gossypium barbadense TaxID=3634 RepID=A0A2P5XFR4_GOSBA|nr:hypothetical protein GOBAR_AA18487 [Gossypium barbadense]